MVNGLVSNVFCITCGQPLIETPCPTCTDTAFEALLRGYWRPVGYDWSSDPGPSHINCRCVIIPVTEAPLHEDT